MKDAEFIRDVELNYAVLCGIKYYEQRTPDNKKHYDHYFTSKKNDDIRASRLTKANEILIRAIEQCDSGNQNVSFEILLRQGLSEVFFPFSQSLYTLQLRDLINLDCFANVLNRRADIKILFFGDLALHFQEIKIDLGAYLAAIPDHIFAVNLSRCFNRNHTSIKEIIAVLSRLPYHIRSISLCGIDFKPEELVSLFAQMPWYIRHIDIDLFSDPEFIKENSELEQLAKIKPTPINAPVRFEQLFSRAATTHDELLAGAKALLESYTMGVNPVSSVLKRAISLHWGRHHVKVIAEIIRGINAPMGSAGKISTVQELMRILMAIPLENINNGSLLLRIQYIEARMWAAEPDLLRRDLLLSSQPSCSYGTMLNKGPLLEINTPSFNQNDNIPICSSSSIQELNDSDDVLILDEDNKPGGTRCFCAVM